MKSLQKPAGKSGIVLFFLLMFCAAVSIAARNSGPCVRVLSPQPEEIVPGPDVTVTVATEGIVFAPGACNLHFMLDNEPFEVRYDVARPHRFHDVPPGSHTIRVYAANHLHELIPGTLDVITFSVAYPDDRNRPESGEPMLTYVLPQGEYLGVDSADITLIFEVTGVPLSRRGYRVNWIVDGRRQIAYDCTTQHLRNLAPGFHTVRLELVDERGRIVPGPFNSVERVILLSPDKQPKLLQPGEKPPEQPTIQSIPGAMTGGRQWVAVDPYRRGSVEKKRSEKQTLTVRDGADKASASDFKVRNGQTGYERLEQEAIAPDGTEEKSSPADKETKSSSAVDESADKDESEKNARETKLTSAALEAMKLRKTGALTPEVVATLRTVALTTTRTEIRKETATPPPASAPTATVNAVAPATASAAPAQPAVPPAATVVPPADTPKPSDALPEDEQNPPNTEEKESSPESEDEVSTAAIAGILHLPGPVLVERKK